MCYLVRSRYYLRPRFLPGVYMWMERSHLTRELTWFSDLCFIRAEADEPRCCVVLLSRVGATHGCDIVAVEMFWL